jgi:hypothetical protein
VQMLSLLRHNTDPHHVDGHAAILARADREERIPLSKGGIHAGGIARQVASFGSAEPVLPGAFGRRDVGRPLPSVRGNVTRPHRRFWRRRSRVARER